MKIEDFTNDQLIFIAKLTERGELVFSLCKRLIDLESRADYYQHFCEELERDNARLKMQLEE
jgi:hypothetical protein